MIVKLILNQKEFKYNDSRIIFFIFALLSRIIDFIWFFFFFFYIFKQYPRGYVTIMRLASILQFSKIGGMM